MTYSPGRLSLYASGGMLLPEAETAPPGATQRRVRIRYLDAGRCSRSRRRLMHAPQPRILAKTAKGPRGCLAAWSPTLWRAACSMASGREATLAVASLSSAGALSSALLSCVDLTPHAAVGASRPHAEDLPRVGHGSWL
eukprot:scaffold150784_cov40-Prasinocladus_malaysianus.AAC.1